MEPRGENMLANTGEGAQTRSATDVFPKRPSLPAAREAAASCRGCGLYRAATQTVFGAGISAARLMLVGETPGDREDLAGEPFVGPAGRLLDRALSATRSVRANCYVTNVVKHFKFEPRGKRRLHRRPSPGEIGAFHEQRDPAFARFVADFEIARRVLDEPRLPP